VLSGQQSLKEFVSSRHGIPSKAIKRQVLLKVVKFNRGERARDAEENQ
jgi:hypothetical protein